jgi:hypothetical protein
MKDDTKTEPLLHRIWSAVAVACGLGLSAAWTTLLGYEIANLIKWLI